MPFGFTMPLRFLRGNYGRMGLTVVALACGVALVCAIDLVNRAVLRAFVEVVDNTAGKTSLQITTGQGGLFAEDLAEVVTSVPGVALVVPVVTGTAFTTDGSGELLTVHGIDVTNEQAVRVYDARDEGGLEVEDPLVFLSQPDSVILTRAFAEPRGISVSDPIDLLTPTGTRTFTVRGLLEPQGVARVYGGNLLVMDLLAAEAAFTRPGFVNRLDVVVEQDADPGEVSAQIRSRLAPGLGVETPGQRKLDLQRVMRAFQTMLTAVSLIGLVTAFLIAFNRLGTVYSARVWQLGVLRAVGLRARTAWWELMKESLVVGIAGIAIGIPLGIMVGRLFLPVIATTTALAFSLVAPQAELSVRPASVLSAILLGLCSAMVAAILPSWRATRVCVAEVLRSRGVEPPGGSSSIIGFIRVASVACVVLAIGVQSMTATAIWGLVATGCIVVCAALTARPMLQHSAFRLLARISDPSARFAAAGLRCNPARAALTAGTLGVGLGAVLWLWIVGLSFEHSVTDKLQTVMRADLVATSQHVAAGLVEAPVDERVMEEIRKIAGVETVIGERVAEWQHAGGPIAIDAFDPAYFLRPEFGELSTERSPNAEAEVATGTGVIVSGNYVMNNGATIGDEIVLDTPRGPLPLRISGVTMHFLSPRGTIELSRELYRKFWGDPQVTHVLIHLHPEADVAAVRASMAQALGHEYGLRILSPADVFEFFAQQVRRCFAAFDILTLMVLVVVMAAMTDTLIAGVLERSTELGVARSVGMRRSKLSMIVLIESVTIATGGLVIAGVTGMALGALWVESTFPYLLGWVLQLHYPWTQAVILAGGTFAVCLFAAALPAIQASRLSPAAALRYE